MKHSVDPTVDCVFKAILGSNEHINLLLNFVNSVCQDDFASPITNLTIINPYNEKDFLSDKMSIVDVKANDGAGNIFQIEIQMFVSSSLKQRMVHNWSELYSRQLKEGDSWGQLKPVISIWLANKPVFKNFSGFHSHFGWYDVKNKLKLTEHANIHIIELNKWDKSQVDDDLDRWTCFFREGKDLNDSHLPDYMQTKEMGQAMAILKQFSEKELAYDRYRARINYLRDQKAMEEDVELAKNELKQAKADISQAKADISQVRADIKQAKSAASHAQAEKKQAEADTKQAEEDKERAESEMQKIKVEYAKILAEKDLELEKIKTQLK